MAFAPSIYLINPTIKNLVIQLYIKARYYENDIINDINCLLTLFELFLDYYQKLFHNQDIQKRHFRRAKNLLCGISFKFLMWDIYGSSEFKELHVYQQSLCRIRMNHAFALFYILPYFQQNQNATRFLVLLGKSILDYKKYFEIFEDQNYINLFWLKSKKLSRDFCVKV